MDSQRSTLSGKLRHVSKPFFESLQQQKFPNLKTVQQLGPWYLISCHSFSLLKITQNSSKKPAPQLRWGNFENHPVEQEIWRTDYNIALKPTSRTRRPMTIGTAWSDLRLNFFHTYCDSLKIWHKATKFRDSKLFWTIFSINSLYVSVWWSKLHLWDFLHQANPEFPLPLFSLFLWCCRRSARQYGISQQVQDGRLNLF